MKRKRASSKNDKDEKTVKKVCSRSEKLVDKLPSNSCEDVISTKTTKTTTELSKVSNIAKLTVDRGLEREMRRIEHRTELNFLRLVERHKSFKLDERLRLPQPDDRDGLVEPCLKGPPPNPFN
eukprot:GHVH01006153.1.p2 GENE.GHVH01006153.1~~GHVH01006153.1.p2  ORF type:complete len:123 (-),score=22.22 GHVH01006153.1:673-1041(-)